ncbi:NUDIX domain-containing protein [Labedella populi]|uniref:NUDIX domain-containing protein n=1 Tax=Labedella populi TaxID=2498850 RepID=A0A444QEF3_9MICO|nr:NUDIX hydrolase [Labedella populi]RWZ67908.1 NUDIX domain-containing protein [Labedella populi]
MDIRVAAYGVIIEGAQILLAHWNEHGRSGWTLPGGGIDPGEDPAAAAVREIREETGFEAEIDGVLGVDSFVISADRRLTPEATGPLHAIRIVYRARVIGGSLAYEENGSTDYAEWIALEQIPSLDRVSLVDIGLGYL